MLALAAAILALAAMWAALGEGAGGAAATPGQVFRAEEVTLLVDRDGEAAYLHVSMLVHDDGSRPFAEAAAAARASVLQTLPGTVEVGEGDVTAAYVAAPYYWEGAATAWAYNPAGGPGLPGEATLVASAAASWNGAGGSPWAFAGGGTTGATPGGCQGERDGVNTAGWRPLSAPGVLGRTCTWFGRNGGSAAIEFDIELDPDWDWTAGTPISIDLFTIAAHEFGHALGLDHTQFTPCSQALMCERYRSGTAFDGPQADDVAGLVSIYGGSAPGITPTPTATPPGLVIEPTPPPPPPAPPDSPAEAPDAPPGHRLLVPLMARD